jgi:sugar (pentulose or hexulose) kinase
VYVMGIDVGTQGARALIVDTAGSVQADGNAAFPLSQLTPEEAGFFEQDPRTWRAAVLDAIRAALAEFRSAGHAPGEIAALSVTSTSGTLCLIDANGEALRPAIMYSDMRSSGVAREVQAAGAEIAHKLGLGYSASYALSKLRWVQEHEPDLIERARWFTSPTDLVIGWLTGRWDRTDWTNALKWGYDVVDLQWPAFIAEGLGLPLTKFPKVEAPGTPVARVSSEAAQCSGLAVTTLVVAGSTDGTASQFASGAAAPGDWNSTLGTTLVLKGVSETLLRDPMGRLYCHRHPDIRGGASWWLPGGASSTGADCLSLRFASADLDRLNSLALARSPTGLILYPLMRRGERLPFSNPEAEGFSLGQTGDEATYYAAHLEGMAYVERMSYEVVESLGGRVGEVIHVAGGGSRSDAGLQIRADVLGRRLQVPVVPLGAMGAAIVAARGVAFPSVAQAARAMVRYARVVEPRQAWRAAYAERYGSFVEACRERGYLA